MTPLARQIAETIRLDGPIPLERYMALCLGHPEHGYYMTRDPLGRAGDFTTAPEVSQIFGELIGIWCISTWQMMGAPDDLHLVELGPGRGTLMADLLRATKIMPGFDESTHVHLVDTSPALAARQQKALARSGFDIAWHSHIDEVPAGNTLIVANEFLDALPVRQIERGEAGWHERMVGLDADGQLTLGLAADPLPANLIPDWAHRAAPGSIAELAPARDAYCRTIASRLGSDPGAALLIDYGHTASGIGDTLQAVQHHQPVGILHQPGEADLTAHVDFAAAKALFDAEGLTTHGPITQSRFLAGLGLAERLDILCRRADARTRMTLKRAAQRLVAGNEMGQLFKVLAVTHPDVPEPAPFAQMAEAAKS